MSDRNPTAADVLKAQALVWLLTRATEAQIAAALPDDPHVRTSALALRRECDRGRRKLMMRD